MSACELVQHSRSAPERRVLTCAFGPSAQDEMRLQNTQCDNCLIGFMVAAQARPCLAAAQCCTACTCLPSHACTIRKVCVPALNWASVLSQRCGCLRGCSVRNPPTDQRVSEPAKQTLLKRHGADRGRARVAVVPVLPLQHRRVPVRQRGDQRARQLHRQHRADLLVHVRARAPGWRGLALV